MNVVCPAERVDGETELMVMDDAAVFVCGTGWLVTGTSVVKEVSRGTKTLADVLGDD